MKDPRKEALIAIYNDHKDMFHFAPGSGSAHQAWEGGYADHIAECLRINEAYFNALSEIRPPNFLKDSAIIALFFHDIEKPFRRGPKDDPRCIKWQEKFGDDADAWENAKYDILDEMKKEYGFEFTEEEENALKYTHGEGHNYQKGKRIALPLAAHVHHCDNTSARIWYNDGRSKPLSLKH